MPLSLGKVPVVIDYTTRDYEGFRDDALNLALTLTPEWNDHSPGDLGVVLTEVFAYMADILSFHGERCLNEAFVSAAVQRRSMINLGRLVGYELHPASSAIVSLDITFTGPGVLPARTQVSTIPQQPTESEVVFETLSDFTALAAGTFSVDCIQGRSVIDEVIGSGDDTASQKFLLSSAPLVIDPLGVASLQVEVDEGAGFVLYAVVTNFQLSQPLDRHVRFEIDELDRTRVLFGNGVRGRVAVAGVDNIRATYRVGGGAISNQVGAHRITSLNNPPTFISAATNPRAPLGGSAQESVDEARVNIPLSVEALDRAITFNDFEYLAQKVAGIAQAKAVQGLGPYEVLVYVAAEGADPFVPGTWDSRTDTGNQLLGGVGSYLTARKAAPIRLDIKNFFVVELDIRLNLVVAQGYYQADVESAVRQRILADVAALKLGEDLLLTSFDWALSRKTDVPGLLGVEWIRFSKKSTARLVNPDPLSGLVIPDVLWTISPQNVGDSYPSFALRDTPKAAPEERWEIRFLDGATFEVRGGISGLQSNLGTLGVDWVSDAGYLTLRADLGAVAPYNGARYEISVGAGPLSARIQIGDFEAFKLLDAHITVVDIHGGIDI